MTEPSSTDLTVTYAVARQILSLNLVPTTTLIASTVPGDLAYTVANPANLIPAEIAMVWDNAGEEPLAIAGVAGNVVSLDFTDMGYDGLQAPHTTGALVTSNLLPGAVNDTDSWLRYGQPFIYIVVTDEQIVKAPQFRQYAPVYTVHIEYRRTAIIPPDLKINSNVWALRVQNQARADLNALVSSLLQHPRLTDPTLGQQALDFGDAANSSRPVIDKSWHKMIVSQDNQQFVGALDLVVRGFFVTVAPNA